MSRKIRSVLIFSATAAAWLAWCMSGGFDIMAIKGVNPFEMAQAQFDKVAAILDLDPATRELLR